MRVPRSVFPLYFVLSLALSLQGQSLPLAFPGAAGYGSTTPGGRGGDVYHVTTLADSGPGSLRGGIQTANGPRTIVFDVSGNIALRSTLAINKPFLTLAGQTAPGDGITVSGFTTVITGTNDVIVRYLRFRGTDLNCPAMQGDSLWVDRSRNVILDHVTATWSIDENLSVTDSDQVTVQWSIIGESLNQSCHEKGEHGYGSLIRYGGGQISFHHNLFIHNHSRNPRVGDGISLDFVNNVIYNYGARGGEAGYSGPEEEGVTRVSYVGNSIIAGPSTDASRRTRAFNGGSTNTQIFQSGNRIDGNLNKTRDGVDTGWAMFIGRYTRAESRFSTQPAAEEAGAAYERVLASAGASLVRDAVDQRLIADVRDETGAMVDSQRQVGGLPRLFSKPVPKDTDGDGMPDWWEIEQGLNPVSAADGAVHLERYLQDLVEKPRAAGENEPEGVILDDRFADGNSQNQDLKQNSVWLFNGRTNNVRTDEPGALTIDMRPAGTSSEAVWAFFTERGAPVRLPDPGDRLTVSIDFSLDGFTANGQDIRFGVFDSLGTRNTTNLGGGHNDATFVNDTGYAVDFFASGTGSPFVIGRRTTLSSANVFNSFGDFAAISGGASGATARQTLANSTPYTLTFSIERLTAAATRITVSVSGGALDGLRYAVVENSADPLTAFDSFAFRVAGTNFATHLRFTRLFVQYEPAPPLITVQPQPSSLTVQAGSPVTMRVAATGNGLSYRWQKNGVPLLAGENPTAGTPELTLARVTPGDAGTYRALVINAGGTVASDAVELRVSATPVPPPPAILVQPANLTAIVGDSATLAVQASGAGLVYQWSKNRVPMPGATSNTLAFSTVRVSDAGSYSVTVANASGSVVSGAAVLTVVSAMQAVSASPWNGRDDLCPDPVLSITFDRKPVLGVSGRIRVVDRAAPVAASAVVDTIDLAANPQTRLIGGVSYNYLPLRIVDGNRVEIYLHKPLPPGGSYAVLVDPGVVLDESGAPWQGFADPSVWSFQTRPAAANSSDRLTVATDGYSDFCTLQAAIDAVPANNTRPVRIDVQPGTYFEINYVPSNKPLLTIHGVDRDSTVIQYPNNANLNAGNARAMFGVDAPDFTIENITLHNTTPKGGSQAEAFRANNQRILVDGVNFKSFQDTLFLQGSVLIRNSYIEGDVDFLWGSGTVFVQDSEIRAVSSGGYYTQVRNAQNQKGFIFVRSRLTAAQGVSNVYLSRIDPGVFPYSQVVFIDCAMGSHILPVGWLLNNATVAPNVQFGEFESRSLETGALLPVNQRAPFSRQLTEAEAARWRDPASLLDGWSPLSTNRK